MAEVAYLAVARFRKPHGLKGEVHVLVLTDRPEVVLAPGRELTPVDEVGEPIGRALVIERSRPYHRHWLLKFRGVDDRLAVEEWQSVLLGVPADDLEPPAEGEIYEHEVPGAAVVVGGEVIGTAVGLLAAGGGSLLAVDVKGREVLVPFRKPIVARVDREGRRIELEPPPGLLEL
ncbi:MAG: ribosome maturation factor RimM [Gemmatimonadales bacterium]